MKSTIFKLPICLFSFLADLHNVYLLSGVRFTQLNPSICYFLSFDLIIQYLKMATILQWSIVHTIIFCTANTSYWMSCQKSELAFSQRFLGSPRGEHCKLLEENIWRKVVSTSKKRFWRKINAFSSQFYYRSIKMMSIQGKSKFLIELPQNML